MKQRTQAGVGVHCRQSQVITEYMENTLPTDVDILSIDRFVIFFAFVDYVYCIFGGHLIYLEVMWLRIKCYCSARKRVKSPTMSGIARDGILYFFI